MGSRFFSNFLRNALVCAALGGVAAGVFAQDSLDQKLEDLERMMQKSGVAMPAFRELKLVAKEPGPFAGMDALVYDAMVDQDGRSVPQRIVFFTDKERRYLVMGSILDLNEKRDVGEHIAYSTLSGELSLASLQRVPLLPGKSKRTVSIVVDLGEQGGRSFVSDLMGKRNQLSATVEMALVSNAQDEGAVGGQAIIAGSQATPFFYESLSQWLKDNKRAAFMAKDKLRKDPMIQARLGRGIFHIESNTNALLTANVKKLPLIYITEDGKSRSVKPPANAADWCEIFGCR